MGQSEDMEKKEEAALFIGRLILYSGIIGLTIILLFFWFTEQNSRRTEEQNRNYAVDSVRLKSEQIDEELNNALNQIITYACFVGEGLSEPVITSQMLEEMEENSQFIGPIQSPFL